MKNSVTRWLFSAVLAIISTMVSQAITTDDINACLDLTGSKLQVVDCSDGGWTKKTGNFTFGSLTVPVLNNNWLQGKVASAGSKTRYYLVFQVKGEGVLNFNCAASVDAYNNSEISTEDRAVQPLPDDQEEPEYEDDPYGWSKGEYMNPAYYGPDEEKYPYTVFWEYYDNAEDAESLASDTIEFTGGNYTKTMKFYLYPSLSTTSEDYCKPEPDEKFSGTIYLDAFFYVPSTEPLVYFYPGEDEEGTGICGFKDKIYVKLDQNYDNVDIYYTTDGSDPIEASSKKKITPVIGATAKLYDPSSSGILVTETCTIKAEAIEIVNGSTKLFTDKVIYSCKYVKTSSLPSIAPVSCDLTKGEATFNFASPDAAPTFFYTTNGDHPEIDAQGNPVGSTKVGSSVTVNNDCVIQVMAKAGEAYPPSESASCQVYIKSQPANLTLLADGTPGAFPYFETSVAVNYTPLWKDCSCTYRLSGSDWKSLPAGTLQITTSGTTELFEFVYNSDKEISQGLYAAWQQWKLDQNLTIGPFTQAGWYLISVPGIMTQESKEQLIARYQLYVHHKCAYILATPEHVQPGRAFWYYSLKSDTSTLNLKYALVEDQQYSGFDSRFNLVGPLNNAPRPIPQGFGWDGKSYTDITELPANGGGWVSKEDLK